VPKSWNTISKMNSKMHNSKNRLQKGTKVQKRKRKNIGKKSDCFFHIINNFTITKLKQLTINLPSAIIFAGQCMRIFKNIGKLFAY
jgi:hypothetical protein